MRWLLFGLVLAAGAARAQSVERCVEARVGGDVAYSCLNDSFARLVDRAHTPEAMNTLTARSPAPAIGSFNRSATAERMGSAFGHSVVSQRPGPPVYADPLLSGARSR